MGAKLSHLLSFDFTFRFSFFGVHCVRVLRKIPQYKSPIISLKARVLQAQKKRRDHESLGIIVICYLGHNKKEWIPRSDNHGKNSGKEDHLDYH